MIRTFTFTLPPIFMCFCFAISQISRIFRKIKTYRSNSSMVRSIKNFRGGGGGRWGQGRREVVGVVAGGVAGTETPSVTLV